ncbi:MAG: 3H domain-containing protein [Eubacteriales bacterium]|nr:3H domain-containing protein [Eubacteriales bacterium]
MNAKERRAAIAERLAQADRPLSAAALAAACGVSRQIIVGDVALLRAGGLSVLATPRGYVLEAPVVPTHCERRIACRHDDDRLRDELYSVVDLGGALLDVTVEHPIYGQICAPLHVFSRFDADAFCDKLSQPDARPLCELTGGIHLHTIRAADEAALDRIVRCLREKGLLLSEDA